MEPRINGILLWTHPILKGVLSALSYFVTGGTGFIGRNLIRISCCNRKGTVSCSGAHRARKKKFNDLVKERLGRSLPPRGGDQR